MIKVILSISAILTYGFYLLVRRNDLTETKEQKDMEDMAQVQYILNFNREKECKRKGKY